MSQLRLAVIGAGHLGRIHARLAKSIDSIDLIGVVDPNAEARDRVATELDISGFADYFGVINNIDAAIIAAPTKLHHAIASDLLEADIHCLIEKPVTSTTQEADELIELASDRGLVLQVGHVERFNPALDIVHDNLGSPRYIQATRTSSYTFRSTDVGVVLDLMIHDIDIVLSLVDSELVEVRAIGAAIFGGFEDVAQARLEFANGCVANLTASRSSFAQQRNLEVFAEDGYAGLDLANHSATLVKPSKNFTAGRIPFTGLTQPEMDHIKETLFTDVLQKEQVTVEPRNAILEEQRDFVESIFADQWPMVTGTDGRNALNVAEQILTAISQHRWSSGNAPQYSEIVKHPQTQTPSKSSPMPSDQLGQRRKAG
jgi:predicted dehydrogenase